MSFAFTANHSVRLSLLGSRNAAKDAVIHSLDELGWKYSEVFDGAFEASVRITPWSWGEHVNILLNEPNHITIESICIFPLQIFDWGKNKQNVELFLKHFEAREMRNLKHLTEPNYLDASGRSPLGVLVEDGE
jgi:hypothetical protein